MPTVTLYINIHLTECSSVESYSTIENLTISQFAQLKIFQLVYRLWGKNSEETFTQSYRDILYISLREITFFPYIQIVSTYFRVSYRWVGIKDFPQNI